MSTIPFKCAAAVIAVLTLTNCAQNPVTGNPNFVMMSESQEVQTGRREDANVRKQYGVYDDKALQQYVNEVGQQLAKNSHRPALQYSFLVVDSPEINAFALPGGYIYVTRGILAYLNSEAELAGVLGHEIGHVTARHSVQQLSAATVASVGSALLEIFVPALRNQAGDALLNVLGNALLSGYGREHELEADRLGAQYLARTNYDPQAMIKVVSVLKNQELFDIEVAKSEGRQPRAYHGLFATHPDGDTRLRQVIAEAGRPAGGSARINQEEFLRRVDRMVFADSPEQGVFRDGHFLHVGLGLGFTFPKGWQTRNRPDHVAATNSSNDAIVDLRGAGPAQGAPADVLRKLIGGGAGQEIRPMTINGLNAASTSLNLRGMPTRLAVVFIDKAAYVISSQAKTVQAMQRVMHEVSQAMNSIRVLSEDERKRARPLTVRVISAAKGVTFAELARTSPLGRYAESHLRLINGMYPKGEPALGQAIKIVE